MRINERGLTEVTSTRLKSQYREPEIDANIGSRVAGGPANMLNTQVSLEVLVNSSNSASRKRREVEGSGKGDLTTHKTPARSESCIFGQIFPLSILCG